MRVASVAPPAVGIVLLLAAINVVGSALFFLFGAWPIEAQALAPAFLVVCGLEVAAHLAVAVALLRARWWGRIAALVLGGMNLVILGPPVIAALVIGWPAGAVGPYASEAALVATGVLAVAALAGNVALIILVARSLAEPA